LNILSAIIFNLQQIVGVDAVIIRWVYEAARLSHTVTQLIDHRSTTPVVGSKLYADDGIISGEDSNTVCGSLR
jgi:hypothetical protein